MGQHEALRTSALLRIVGAWLFPPVPHRDERRRLRSTGGGQVLVLPSQVHVGQTLADPDWDRFVEATPGGTYQQTSMWAQVKSVAGWRPVRIGLACDGAVVAGCQVLVRRLRRLGAIGYVSYGPLVAEGDGAVLPAVLDAVQELVREERLLYLKLQPPADSTDMAGALRERQFIPGRLDPAPRMTVRVDLRRSPDEILAAMRARSRTYIRQAQRRGVVVREGGHDELAVFCRLVEATSRRQGFSPYPRAYYEQLWHSFRGRVHLLVAEYQGEILSSALLLTFGDTVNYKMGGWSGSRRDVRPNELLHWTGMRWARDRGYRYYDLEGIIPAVGEAILAGRDIASRDISGVTHFKLGLGGDVTRLSGSYDYIRQPLLRAALPSVAPRLERLTPIAHRLSGRRKATRGALPVTRLDTSGERRWRSPIQLGYSAKPWWKFAHLQRFNRILMPICRRFYPVGADVDPPADIDALAQWMERWGLVPARLPRAVARRQLQALESSPVETVNAGGVPDRASSEILRLPAEWEPSEAVVVTWPVLFPGFWDFYRELVAAIVPAARVDVLIPHAIYAPAVLAYLGEGRRDDRRLRLLVTASDDIWVRDYGPLTCIDKAAQRVMVDAIFDPPPTPSPNDDSFPVRYAAHRGLPCRHLALHLEGGNLWSDGQGTIITTEGLYARNFPIPADDVRQQLLEGLGAEKLIVVPPLRMEGTGHVDVFVKLATPDTVLVTEPRSVVNGRRLKEVAEVLRASRNAAGCCYRVVALPSAPAYCNWGVSRIWPSYTNALTVNHRVIVPIYGLPERDAAALAVYRQVLPDHEIIGIDARVAANAGGTVHCLTMQIPGPSP
jgi:agmatine deiminase